MHCIFPDKIIDPHVAPQQQDKMKFHNMMFDQGSNII